MGVQFKTLKDEIRRTEEVIRGEIQENDTEIRNELSSLREEVEK